MMDLRKNSGRRNCCTAAVAAVVLLASAVCVRAAEKLPGDLTSCVDEAKQANVAHDIELERRVLAHAETLEGDAKDAAEAQRHLAVLDWRYHHRFDEARSRLLRAAENGAEPAKAWIALARMEQAREDHAAAREAATQALETARKDSERRGAVPRPGPGLGGRGRGVAPRRGGRRYRGAPGGVRRPVRPGDPGAWPPEHRHIFFCAPRCSWTEATLPCWPGDRTTTWRPAAPHPTPSPRAGEELEADPLRAGQELKMLPPRERIDLVKALAGTRFFEEAALVALDPRADESVRENPRREATGSWRTPARDTQGARADGGVLSPDDPGRRRPGRVREPGQGAGDDRCSWPWAWTSRALPSDDELDALFDDALRRQNHARPELAGYDGPPHGSQRRSTRPAP